MSKNTKKGNMGKALDYSIRKFNFKELPNRRSCESCFRHDCIFASLLSDGHEFVCDLWEDYDEDREE